jgi:hypothetical protein
LLLFQFHTCCKKNISGVNPYIAYRLICKMFKNNLLIIINSLLKSSSVVLLFDVQRFFFWFVFLFFVVFFFLFFVYCSFLSETDDLSQLEQNRLETSLFYIFILCFLFLCSVFYSISYHSHLPVVTRILIFNVMLSHAYLVLLKLTRLCVFNTHTHTHTVTQNSLCFSGLLVIVIWFTEEVMSVSLITIHEHFRAALTT